MRNTTLLFMFMCGFASVSSAETHIEKAQKYKQENNLHKSNYYYLYSIKKNENTEQARLGLVKNYMSTRDYAAAQIQIDFLLKNNVNTDEILIMQTKLYIFTNNQAALRKQIGKLEVISNPNEPILQVLDSASAFLGDTVRASYYSKLLAERKKQNIIY